MTKFFLTAGLVLALAWPATAQNRDSDGDVISVIEYTTVPVNELTPVYYTLGADPDIKFRFNTLVQADGGVVLPEQVSLGGTVYQVEQSGDDVFLRVPGSRQRIVAHPAQASGKRVNPTAFALD